MDPGGVGAEHAEGRFDLGAAVVAVHAQRHRQGPGQRVEAAIGAFGEQLQQLDQLLAPGAGLPEHLQGLIEGSPLAAGAEQLGGEHQPLAPLALGEGLRIVRRGGGQGGGGGAQTVGVVEVEQAGGDGAAEALLLGMGRTRQVGRQPTQLAPQGGEASAADTVEVGRLHGQGFEPVGQAAGWADHPLGGKGAQLLQQLGPARGQTLPQIGQHPLAGDAIEHQPATGRQKREPLGQLVFELPPAAAKQRPVAQIKAKTPVLLADEVQNGEAALAGVGRQPQAPAELLQEHHRALGGPQEQHGVDGGDVEAFVEEVHGEEDLQVAGLQAAQGGLVDVGLLLPLWGASRKPVTPVALDTCHQYIRTL